jgi:hypothetical protein
VAQEKISMPGLAQAGWFFDLKIKGLQGFLK